MGLHEAGALWQRLFNETLLGISLSSTSANPCVYYRPTDGAMAAIHVDNMLAVVNTKTPEGGDGRRAFVNEIGDLFKVVDNTEKHQFLGVGISHDEEKGAVRLSQYDYITTILLRFGLQGCNPALTPLAPGCSLSKDDCPDLETDEGRGPAKTIAKLDYRSMVGSLM